MNRMYCIQGTDSLVAVIFILAVSHPTKVFQLFLFFEEAKTETLHQNKKINE